MLAGGALAGLLFGGGWAWPTTTDLPRTILGLLAQPGVPAAAYPPQLRAHVPGPGAYWATITALATLQILAAAFAGAYLHARRARPGLARRADVRHAMTGADAGTPIGTYLRLPVRLRAEDSALVIAPARAGKTTRLAVGRIVDAPGPVVATSTKADLVHPDRAHHQPRRPLARVRPRPAAALAQPVPVGRRRRLPRRARGAHPRPGHGRRPTPTRGPQRQLLRRRQRNRAPRPAARRRPRTPVHA